MIVLLIGQRNTIEIYDLSAGEKVDEISGFMHNAMEHNEKPAVRSIAATGDRLYFGTEDGILFCYDYKITSVGDSRRASGNDEMIVIYPNPMSEDGWIEVIPPEPSRIRVDIYNIFGSRVHSEIAEAGNARISIPAHKLMSGGYICKVSVNNQVYSKLFIIDGR
ncbi:MAG: T9SS type A sorting domain-containing protein [Candidatus Kapaibacterium sp.]